MKLVVGLGNPGDEYKNTRHNAGFFVLDKIIEQWQDAEFRFNNKFKSDICQIVLKKEKVILAKPQNYMNKSGSPLLAIINFYKISPDDLMVIYDDKDMEFGKVRFRNQGSFGGHNGIKDIIRVLGNDLFKRIKIGVGNVTDKNFTDAAKFVLSQFKRDELVILEQEIFPKVYEKIIDNL